MLNRDDIERIVENYIRDNLSVQVLSGDFTNPNSRTVVVHLGPRIISSDSFSIVQEREYEG